MASSKPSKFAEAEVGEPLIDFKAIKGDDVELWRQWTPLLFGFSYANYSSLWQRVAAGVYELPEMERGFTDHLSDVEHTAEMSGDTAWPISVMLDNANFTCNGTSLLERSETRAACAAHDIALLQKRSGQKRKPTTTNRASRSTSKKKSRGRRRTQRSGRQGAKDLSFT